MVIAKHGMLVQSVRGGGSGSRLDQYSRRTREPISPLLQ